MSIPRLIGITGLAGSGKDTLADFISKTYGHQKYSLATPIKELLNARFGWTMGLWDHRVWKETPLARHGWNVEGVAFSPRSWAQWLGTEVGRELGADVWIKRMCARWDSLLPVQKMVVPDVRFDNEADTIRRMGGVIVHVIRPSVAPVNAHVSEKGVRPEFIDVTITNDRSIDEFLYDADFILS